MRIVGAQWTPKFNLLVIRCRCDKTITHRADRWKAHCDSCGAEANLSVLRHRYVKDEGSAMPNERGHYEQPKCRDCGDPIKLIKIDEKWMQANADKGQAYINTGNKDSNDKWIFEKKWVFIAHWSTCPSESAAQFRQKIAEDNLEWWRRRNQQQGQERRQNWEGAKDKRSFTDSQPDFKQAPQPQQEMSFGDPQLRDRTGGKVPF